MAYESGLGLDEGRLKDWIEATYDLVVIKLEVRPGYRSTVIFVDTPAARFVLKCKKYNPDDAARSRVQIAFLEHLWTKALPVAKCVLGRDQQPVFAVGEVLFSMWAFLEGEVYTPGNRKQLEAAGNVLGKIHLASSDLQTKQMEMRFYGWAEHVAQLKSDWPGLEAAGKKGRALVRCLQGHLAQWDAPKEKGKRILVHSDFRAQNLMYQGDAVSGVIDFDEVSVGLGIFDVAYGLAFFQAVISDRALDEAEMLAFLEGYDQVNPFAVNELADLPYWLGLALLKGLTLWGRLCYVDLANPNAHGWIDGYLPVLKQVKDLGSKLKFEFKG